MKLNTKLRHICRLHEGMIALMTEVKTETNGEIDFFDIAQGNDIQIVRGIKRISEELKAEIWDRKDAAVVLWGHTTIMSLFRD